MDYITTGSLMSFILFGMGLFALIVGTTNFLQNLRSVSDRIMFYLCLCLFVAEFGYAWMSACYNHDFAYTARAIGLAGILTIPIFYMQYISCMCHFSKRITNLFCIIYSVIEAVAYCGLVSTASISFHITPWGYWYSGIADSFRFIETSGMVIAIVYTSVVLVLGLKRVQTLREKHVVKLLMIFPVIIGICFTLDTLIPSIFEIPALPGSCIGVFLGVLWTFYISEKKQADGTFKRECIRLCF